MAEKDSRAGQPSPSLADRLRKHIDEITGRRGKAGAAPEDGSEQPKSLNEIIEERMRDHVGEKKP